MPENHDHVERVVISAHMNRMAIQTGKGQSIHILDVVGAAYDQHKFGQTNARRLDIGERPVHYGPARSNDYRRHIGDDFRLILNGCSVGEEDESSPLNIANMLCQEYGATVDASDTSHFGLVVRQERDGLKIRFKTTLTTSKDARTYEPGQL